MSLCFIETLGKNFDKLLISIIGIKWLPDTIELTITIEGKNLVYPLVLNILEIQQDTLEPVLYISNSLDDECYEYRKDEYKAYI